MTALEEMTPVTGGQHTHSGSGCHDKARDHTCPRGQKLSGHSDCVVGPPRLAAPTGLALECSDDGESVIATWSASDTNLPAGRVVYRLRGGPAPLGDDWRRYLIKPNTSELSAVVAVEPGTAYEFKIRATDSLWPGEGPSTEFTAAQTITCQAPNLAAPTGVSASCSAGGVLSVSWRHQGPLAPQRLQFDVEIDGTTVDDAVNYRSVPGAEESYSYRWEQAESNRAHRVSVRAAPSPAGIRFGEDRETAWTAPVTANKCDVFKPSGFTTATCNAHGVVHLKWNPVGGVDRYDLKNTAPDEESTNYQGPATEVYAQRWEGETYDIRIRARARTGQKWSGWTAAKEVKCDPLNPVSPVWPQWRSPSRDGRAGGATLLRSSTPSKREATRRRSSMRSLTA